MGKHELDKTREDKRILAQEEFILEVTEALCRRMNEKGVTRAELARRTGRSTQCLGAAETFPCAPFPMWQGPWNAPLPLNLLRPRKRKNDDLRDR
jgi:hypothetical protein